MATGKFVAYYRVSTDRQGRSGLGLDAQRAAVKAYLDGGRWTLLREFTEVESGKRDDNRPQLRAALHLAKVTGARLIVAKLDRLSRNAAFLLTLRDSGVRFVCADQPEISELTVGILAVVAEDERRRISERTRAALAEARKRGTRLGNPHGVRALRLADKGNVAALAGIKRRADAFVLDVAPILDDIAAAGIVGHQAIARELARREIRTARGGDVWTATGVRRLMVRLRPATEAA